MPTPEEIAAYTLDATVAEMRALGTPLDMAAVSHIEDLRALLRQHLCNADGVMSVGECVDTSRCSCTCGLKL